MNKEFWIFAQKCWRKTMDANEHAAVDVAVNDIVIEILNTKSVNPISKNPLDDMEEYIDDDED